MIKNPRRILIIGGIIFIVLCVVIILIVINNNNSNSYTDPVTGLEIVKSNATPETADPTMKPPAVIGFSDLSVALGNDSAFTTFTGFIHSIYSTHSFVKMKKGSLSETSSFSSNNDPLVTYIFDVYLDNTTQSQSAYHFAITVDTINQNTLTLKITNPDKKVADYTLTVS